MTPKEKAEELVNIYRKEILKGKYRIHGFVIEELAEQCALISVDEIIDFAHLMDGGFSFEKEIEYWKQVKQEIEKL